MKYWLYHHEYYSFNHWKSVKIFGSLGRYTWYITCIPEKRADHTGLLRFMRNVNCNHCFVPCVLHTPQQREFTILSTKNITRSSYIELLQLRVFMIIGVRLHIMFSTAWTRMSAPDPRTMYVTVTCGHTVHSYISGRRCLGVIQGTAVLVLPFGVAGWLDYGVAHQSGPHYSLRSVKCWASPSLWDWGLVQTETAFAATDAKMST